MRVLMTTDSSQEVGRFNRSLARILTGELGVQVILAVLDGIRAGTALPQEIPVPASGTGSIHVELLDLPLEREGAKENTYLQAREQLLHLALHCRAHILHTGEYHIGALGASGLPVLVVSHGDLYSHARAHGADPLKTVGQDYRRRAAHGLRSAALVVAPHNAAATALTAWYGYSDVIRIIPHGTEQPVSKHEVPRDMDAVADGERTDNLDCFYRAIGGLRGVFATTAAELPRTGDDYPAAPHTHHWSPDSGLAGHYARARIFVAPSRYDPFGLTLVEAAMAGCALLVSDVPEYRTVWGPAALYFDPDDPVALRSTLALLASDQARTRLLAARAHAHALRWFTAGRMGRAYLSTYQRIALRYGISL